MLTEREVGRQPMGEPKTKPNFIAPMLWLALKPTQARHIVVSFVMTGEICLMLR